MIRKTMIIVVLGLVFLGITAVDAQVSTKIPLVGSGTSVNAPSEPSGPGLGYANASYSYSTNATDPNGNQVKYTFDWGDGTKKSTTKLVNSGTKASASHKWSKAGTYKVKAYATDNKGASSGNSSSLNVFIAANKIPKVPSKPFGSASGYANASYSYSTNATDPDGNQVKYTFDWGDGTKKSTTSLVHSDTNASASHKWSKAGTYKVKAYTTDNKGASSVWSSTLDVKISSAKK
jgi:hypothetical protein